MLADCEKGNPEAWRVFLSHYTPVVFRLLETYAPKLESSERKSIWCEALQRLAAEDSKCLRRFDHQAEREFLMDLKWFVLDRVPHGGHEARGRADDSSKTARARLDGRPLAHQEIALLFLAGYRPATIEKVLTVPGSLVATALTPTIEPLDWLRILPEVRAAAHICPHSRRASFVVRQDASRESYGHLP